MPLGGIALAADFAIVIVAATVLSYAARRTGQPTLVAYILTGIVLGPVLLGVVTEEQLIEVMAELGLGFLLFVLGIEMRFERIKGILRPIVNIAIGQTILQTAAAFGIAFLLGFRGMDVFIIALATVFGATPIIVKLLDEKGDLKSLPGRIDIGVLIVQDIYLVIVLALVGAGLEGTAGEILFDVAWILGLMAAMGAASYVAYQYVLPTLLESVASDRNVLFVVGLAWAFLFIFVAEALELSVEVGAFIAGLSLAQLPYSTELKERMRPVTDFFLVVFFTSIGLQLEADYLLAYWQEALVASAVLMVGNFLIMFYLINRENFAPETSFLGSINMVQVSEFSLVVGALAVTEGLVDEPILGYLSVMALVTMTISTYIIIYNDWIYEQAAPYLERFEDEDQRDASLSITEDHAVVVGYDPVVRETLPVVREAFEDVIVVDRSVDNVDELESRDVDFRYGDIRHGEIREQVDLEHAAFVLSMARPPSVNRQLVEETAEDTFVVAAAEHVNEAEDLYELGADYVALKEVMAGELLGEYIETFAEDRDRFRESVRESMDRIRERGTVPPEPPREGAGTAADVSGGDGE
ncbi:cation:proton antiporter [Natronococcus occultus]|uniref:Kef-type K+ transport system, membrane component n=1 Tax=Natronococcus occultus SP4 TaxID=694430 RepID=L0K2W3_9EURY|nr:cation:proton antiporter [Natronococcus occultus]AGB38448.1 Kef-type K+ transport system, membrane component [Natronococcus occultus SP4]